jgi:hypothetical protein
MGGRKLADGIDQKLLNSGSIVNSIVDSTVDGNGSGRCGSPQSASYWHQKQMAPEAKGGFSIVRVGGELAIVGTVATIEQCLITREALESPKQSIDGNPYTIAKGITCHVAASGNFCPSASG